MEVRPKQHLLFTEMEEERDKAEAVKQHAPILVILGNPPYNGFAGVSPEEEAGLLEPYKQGLRDWGITKNYLDDLYVRFFRLAERRIAEGAECKGIVSFISNYSWLGEPTYVVVRQHLLKSFDTFWIENMHGDRRISEYSPDGRTSETVFAISGLSPGIQQGTAISLWVKKAKGDGGAQVLFRDDLTEANAAERRAKLLRSLDSRDFTEHYVEARPTADNRYAFWPTSVAAGYRDWPSITALTRVPPMLGMNENRGAALYASEARELEERMSRYYDSGCPSETLVSLSPGLISDAAGFLAEDVRHRLLRESAFDKASIIRAAFRPLDERWAYVERLGGLWNRVRPDLVDQAWTGNQFLVCRCKANKAPDGSAFLMLDHLADQHVLSSDGYFIPVWLRQAVGDAQASLLYDADASQAATSNLSSDAENYLDVLGLPSNDPGVGLQFWLHVLAIGYAPFYILENADGMRRDFPRIPLPATRDALLASADLGRKVAALLDVEEPGDAVTTGSIRHELRPVGVLTSVSGGQLDPAAGDLAVTAGWGDGGKGGVTMPGRGRALERPYTDAELAAFREGLSGLGLTYDQLTACLGGACYDVYLSDVAYWRCVPARVWKYTIGGYQVMKKWLSYRERALLGRDLKPDEARYVSEMTRRIAAILLLEPALDENYERVKADTYPWPAGEGA